MSDFEFKHWPTSDPDRTITQGFGQNPVLYSRFNLPGHEGVDFRAVRGSSVYAVASGTVHSVQKNHPAYGVHVRVDHAHGYQTTYAHLENAIVSPGDKVRAGKVLGKAGNSGHAFGVHLHLNLKRKGAKTPGYPQGIIDPTPFLMPLLDPHWPRISFLGETVPDGTPFLPGQHFEKSWILRHEGGRNWDSGDHLVRVEGPALGMPERAPLPHVGAGSEIAVSVPCTTPSNPGVYRNFWQAQDAQGRAFGPVIWMDIKVTQPAPQHIETVENLVRTDGGHFVLHGQPFHFLGVNIRGLLHFGRCSEDPLKNSTLEHRNLQLQAARDLGARVVRVFLPDRNASPEEIEERFAEVLDMMDRQFPELFILPAFTNLYNDVPFHVPGDQKYYANAGQRDLLTKDFFLDGYIENYLPLLERIVTRFRDRSNIFAWEIGNELKLNPDDKANANDPNPNLFIDFNRKVANRIKELDPHHLVTTGMISTFHSWLHSREQKRALYSSPSIDFLTIHSYKGRDLRSEDEVIKDAALATALNKPFIVEEAGVDREVHPHRAPHYQEHIEHWIRQGASGYMPWGFVRNPETGDGDSVVGFGANLTDFDELSELFSRYAGLRRSRSVLEAAVSMQRQASSQSSTNGFTRRSIVGFDFEEYNQIFLSNPGREAVNDSAGYGVSIAAPDEHTSSFLWKVVGVHHLTPRENKGKHNIYVEVLDEEGERATGVDFELVWGWRGQGAHEVATPAKFDKGPGEPATNLMLRPDTQVWLQIEEEGVVSEKVVGVHSGHPDEHGADGQVWNSWGHHSFYVVFQRVRSKTDDGSSSTPITIVGEPASGEEQATGSPAVSVRWVQAREKLGIDANAPLEEDGRISARLNQHQIFADLGVGWVRLNFVRGPWNGPSDTRRFAGRTWEETYRSIIENLKAQNVSIYGLIGHEAVSQDPEDQFRTPPGSGSEHNEWIDRYVRTFESILDMFGNDVAAWESFNEPDNWNEKDPHEPRFKTNWIHPEWFAIMLQRIHDRAGDHWSLEHVPLVSGPLQGMKINQNSGSHYLRRTFQAGKRFFGWGDSNPFPFDAIGYHLYLTESEDEAVAQYHQFMEELRTVIRQEERTSIVRPIYISEYGWQSAGMGEERQARHLTRGLDALLQDTSVRAGFWFCIQDFAESYGLYPEDSLEADRRKAAYGPFRELCRASRDVPIPSEFVSETASVVPQQWTGRVVASVLNIRSGPGTKHDRIGSLSENTSVEVTGQVGNWYRIAIMGREAYVAAEWVQTLPSQRAVQALESVAGNGTRQSIGHPSFIYGLHEAGGESLMVDAGRPGWILELAEVGLDGGSQSADFRNLANQDLGVIVRLNHGYGSAGTLPRPQHYSGFAAACAKYVARSHGCHRWIIGNEPNHEQERPDGQPILPEDYVNSYRLCRQAIRRLPGHEDDEVLIAGPAPWNAQTRYAENPSGDWVTYFADTLALLDREGCDGFAIHTYTRVHDSTKVRGDFLFDHPEYNHRRDEFRTYRDFMEQIPQQFRRLPVYITETNPASIDSGWDPMGHNDWVLSAYREIADWNQDPTNQPIQALILYRWPPADSAQNKWIISTHSNVIDDLKQAIQAEPKDQFRIRWPKQLETPLPVRLPRFFTNLDLLEASRAAAEVSGVNFSQFMISAGLDAAALSATPSKLYTGPLPTELEGLTAGQRQEIQEALLFSARTEKRASVSAISGLNLRGGPSRNHRVLRPLPFRSRLEVLHSLDGWLLVRAGDDVGYVSSDWISFEENRQQTILPQKPTSTSESFLSRHEALVRTNAMQLGISPVVTAAVFMAESSASGFNADGSLKINFEVHVFYDSWGQNHPEQFHRHFDLGTGRRWEKQLWRSHELSAWISINSQHEEWKALQMARQLDETQALRAVGMGAPQIMGFHYHTLGYQTVQEMFEAFSTSESAQIEGFFRFIESKPGAVEALQRDDYWTFAALYNGRGQEQLYSTRIRNFVTQFQAASAQQKQEAPLEERMLEFPADLSSSELGISALARHDPQLASGWKEKINQAIHQNQELYGIWLGAIYNSYWTRLESLEQNNGENGNDPIGEQVERATRALVDDLERLIDKRSNSSS